MDDVWSHARTRVTASRGQRGAGPVDLGLLVAAVALMAILLVTVLSGSLAHLFADAAANLPS